MTPEQLQAMLNAHPDFAPDQARDEHTNNLPLWRLYLDLLELDRTKLEALIEKHGSEEPDTKVALRKLWAAVINLVPTVVQMVQGYVFAEEPDIDVQGDKVLEAFLKDCDGTGMPWVEYERQKALRLALAIGWVDVLVQNPAQAGGAGTLSSAADAAAANVKPAVFTITPLQRLHWSCDTSGDYNWLRFKDAASEKKNPFLKDVTPDEAYITASAAVPEIAGELGFWIRSSKSAEGKWQHTAGPIPTRRCPIATLYYARSVDPDRPHFGLSKIAMIAVLTRLIVQVMSWTTEDILANLAIIATPTKNGKIPKNEEGESAIEALSAFTQLAFDRDAKHAPFVLQGNVTHIDVKMKFIDMLVREILRQAHLLGASAEAETVTSGVQGVVMRSELFQELGDISKALDTFTLDTLALVKGWADNEDVTRDGLMKGEKAPKVNHFKGPWMMDLMADVIANATAVLALYRETSPTMAESALKQTARAYLNAGDPNLETVMEEIGENTGALLERDAEQDVLMKEAEIAAAKAAALPREAA